LRREREGGAHREIRQCWAPLIGTIDLKRDSRPRMPGA